MSHCIFRFTDAATIAAVEADTHLIRITGKIGSLPTFAALAASNSNIISYQLISGY
jgi:hypothetical protein